MGERLPQDVGERPAEMAINAGLEGGVVAEKVRSLPADKPEKNRAPGRGAPDSGMDL